MYRINSRLLIVLFATSCWIAPAFAQPASGIDELINNAVQPLTTLISSIIFFTIPVFGAQFPLVVIWLVAGATFFTFNLGFINLRGFRHAVRLARGD